MLRSSSAPFYFSLPYFFSSHVTLECHLTFSRDLCHMVNHLISHVTFLAHDRLIVLTDPLFYCLDRLLFTFSIVPAYCPEPHCSQRPLFASLGRLVR